MVAYDQQKDHFVNKKPNNFRIEWTNFCEKNRFFFKFSDLWQNESNEIRNKYLIKTLNLFNTFHVLTKYLSNRQ